MPVRFRSPLTLLLLLNYLLVVGAGLVARPARVIDRPFAYVHRPDCQLTHTLRAGCFDDCNGTQYTVEKPGERPPLHQLLASFKGVDLHCLPVAAPAPPLALRVWAARPRCLARTMAPTGGYFGRVEAPPRRG